MGIDKKILSDLLLRIALKDKLSFEKLYLLTSGRLYSIILRVVKDKDIASELLQEGYLKLWFSEHTPPVEQPWAWLCQMMRNISIDYIRKNKRSMEYLNELKSIDQGDIFLTNSFDNDSNLNRCLLLLEVEKRSAIVLAYQHGLSHSDLVEHLNKPIGTIKSWIRRGLKELKKCIST